MNVEQRAELHRRATVHAALADPTRLRIVDLLATGDASASELGATIGIPSNLLAHHVKVLESAGVVTRRRSEGDARRSYLSLDAHEEWLLGEVSTATGATVHARRVLFVCTANTARSHLAAAAWRRASPVPAVSAGTHPGEEVDRRAIATAERHDLDLPDVPPRLLSDTARDQDLVITVCDRAHEELAGLDWAHWSIPDPVPAATRAAFDSAFADIAHRVTRLAPLLAS